MTRIHNIPLQYREIPQHRPSQKKSWSFWQKTATAMAVIGSLVLIAAAFTPAASSGKIVTARLQGGTGNQLFQAAAACAHAKKIGGVCQFPNNRVNQVGESPVLHKLIRKDTNISKTIKENYKVVTLPDESIKLDGYFQSAIYFDDERSYILDLFGPPPDFDSSLPEKYHHIPKQDNTVAIHVRRGDYLTYSDIYHNLADDSYYADALKHFDKDNHFVIFSDDIEFAKKMDLFKDLKHITFVEGLKAHEDLYLMSKCKNHVIANSSFSWWGAYLSQNLKVVCPTKWFGPGAVKDIGPHSKDASQHICMDKWIKA